MRQRTWARVTHKMGENICKMHTRQGINIQNTQRGPATQWPNHPLHLKAGKSGTGVLLEKTHGEPVRTRMFSTIRPWGVDHAIGPLASHPTGRRSPKQWKLASVVHDAEAQLLALLGGHRVRSLRAKHGMQQRRHGSQQPEAGTSRVPIRGPGDTADHPSASAQKEALTQATAWTDRR